MRRAMGITVHTGWGACVVVAGTPANPEILSSEIIDIVDGAQRFCFHQAAEMEGNAAGSWLARVRGEALASARRALAAAEEMSPQICAIVAKEGEIGDLAQVLASHPRVHTAEGLFYRDILREACSVPTRIVAPRSLDPSKLGKLPVKPWGRDQKLAALAAWSVLRARPGSR
ncbi:MAG TPA: hypothetical protein VHV81_18075 [Steroidobacteraceae bacterium]|jgi:hypothetical protein|nr:hypothetical protein [Steroidobacteraceae bacterium]